MSDVLIIIFSPAHVQHCSTGLCTGTMLAKVNKGGFVLHFNWYQLLNNKLDWSRSTRELGSNS